MMLGACCRRLSSQAVPRIGVPAQDRSLFVAIVPRSPLPKSKKKTDTGELRLQLERVIRAIPPGKVLTYGGVARAAGHPGLSRMVARILHRGFGLPWQRVLGAGGEIKLRGDSGLEQRFRLQAEGVRFRGRRVDMKACEWKLASVRKRIPKNRMRD